MRRLKRGQRRPEKGATAILVALTLVMLCGFAAIAVDAGALWWDRKQLQNGADAGALAIAQLCSKDACPGDEPGEASFFATENKLDANAEVVSVIHPTASSVRVELRSTRTLWFANLLGQGDAEVRAAATAGWGPAGGGGSLPIAISECAFAKAVPSDPPTVIHLIIKTKDKTLEGGDPCDPNPTNPTVIPGGFHWLKPETGCEVITEPGDLLPSSPGNINPTACDAATLQALLLNEEIKIPMYDYAAGKGDNAEYHLVGYAYLRATAWNLTNKVYYPEKGSADEEWLEGYFVKKTDLSVDGDPGGGEDFKAMEVRLIG